MITAFLPFAVSATEPSTASWWAVTAPIIAPTIMAIVALIGAIAALRGSQGKRHRNEQQAELLAEMGEVKTALAAATKQRDDIANELKAEQKRCSEEAAAMRREIAKHNATVTNLMKMVKR